LFFISALPVCHLLDRRHDVAHAVGGAFARFWPSGVLAPPAGPNIEHPASNIQHRTLNLEP
jgi:hypothetical protein